MKITLENRVWISKASGLQQLRPVFNELLQVHQKYIDGEGGLDCPYWYSERPNVAFLAAAVWSCGGTALEEYGTTKTRKRRNRHGRSDVYISIGKCKFECEAKRLWLKLSTTKDAEKPTKKIVDELHKAAKDVGNLKQRTGLALCFVTPVIRAAKEDELGKSVSDYIKSVETKLKSKTASLCDALVWIGVKEGQKLFGNDYKHPGMLLVVKKVR